MSSTRHALGCARYGLVLVATTAAWLGCSLEATPALEAALADRALMPALAGERAWQEKAGGWRARSKRYTAELPAGRPDLTVRRQSPAQALTLRLVHGPTPESAKGGARYLFDSGRAAYVYSAHAAGVKEDIVLTQPIGDALSFAWEWDAPGLEARLDAQGNIGFWGVDETFWSKVSASDAESRARLDRARRSAPRTRLLFQVPAPTVRQASGEPTGPVAQFALEGNRITLNARGLSALHYPISIDPAVIVTTDDDFQSGGNFEQNTAASANRLQRQPTGVGVSGFVQNTHQLLTARKGHGVVVHNGFIYVVGGINGTTQTTSVEMAPIDTDGSIGPFTTTTALPSGRHGVSAAVYSGRIYVTGGCTSSSCATSHDSVLMAAIQPDGSLSPSWTPLNSFGAKHDHVFLMHKGYAYAIGGLPAPTSTVSYAPIHADGTLGTFTATSALSTGRADHVAVAYDGYIHVLGGDNGGFLNGTEVALINADGSLGAWTAGPTLPVTMGVHMAFAARGYLYLLGGFQAGTASSRGYAAPLLPGGRLGAFRGIPGTGWPGDLLRAVEEGQVAHYNDHVYVVGGQVSGAQIADVERGRIDSGAHLGTFAATTSFATGRRDLGAVVHHNRLYVVGGWSAGSGHLNTIQYATVSAAGTVGAFTNNATTFSNPRGSHNVVVYNDYFYVIGGHNGTYLSDVQFAPISTSTGAVGSFTATTSLPQARRNATAFANDGFLYVIGGSDADGSYLDSVIYAPINANGTLGAWATTSAFNTGREEHASVLYNGRLYVIGGQGASVLGDIQYAPILSNGSLGAWVATRALPSALTETAAVVRNGMLFVGGGSSNGTTFTSSAVTSARIELDGSIAPWTTPAPTSLPSVRYKHSFVESNGYLFTLGGDDGSFLASVASAPISTEGTLSAFASTTALPAARDGHTSVAHNGRLYVIGGCNGNSNPCNTGVQTTVSVGTLNANGTVASWANTTPLNVGRGHATAVVSDGYLYVIGGTDGTNPLDSVEYALINTDGTLSSWTTTTSISARFGHASFAYGGRVYVVGGCSSGPPGFCLTPTAGIQMATVQSDHSLGAWGSGGTSFTTARTGHAVQVYNGRVYLLGGTLSGGANPGLADTQISTIQANGTLGSWTKGPSLSSGRYLGRAAVWNGFLYYAGGWTGSDELSAVESSAILSDGTLGGFSPVAALSSGRDTLQVAAHNGFLYAMGGNTGAPTASVLYAQIHTPLAKGFYSRHYDLGASATLNSLTLNGASTLGQARVTYRTAPTAGTWSALIDKGPATLGTPMLLGDTNVRYVWLGLELDDQPSAALNVDSTIARDITDITLDHSGAPTQLAFTNSAHTLPAGGCSGALVVQAQGAGGVPIPVSSAVTVNLSSTHATGTFWTTPTCTGSSVTSVQINSGASSSASFYYRDTLAGSPLVTASASGLTSAAQPQAVLGGSAVALQVAGFPSPTVAGQSGTVTVTAIDAFGNTATGYTGTVTLTSSDAQASLPPAYTFVAGDNGAHTFPATLLTVGVASLVATDALALTGSQTGIVVEPAAAASLLLSGVSSPIDVGRTSDVTVEVRDAFGNVASGYRGTIAFTSSDALAQLPPATPFTAADNGVRLFPAGVRFATVGLQSLQARDIAAPSIQGSLQNIVVNGQVPPLIVRDANLKAAVGAPYLYNALRAITAYGPGPITFETCGGPAGFQVDAVSGAVVWTPNQEGATAVCVAARNAFGVDTYPFTVDVVARAPTAVVARIDANPTLGPAPLQVFFDGSQSQADPSALPLFFHWRFGDGTAPDTQAAPSHPYVLPGGYVASLTAFDAYGASDTASQPIRVLGPGGALPPTARIVASALTGDGSLTVQFSCDCQAGDAPILALAWDFANGELSNDDAPSVTFAPGRYHVRLTAVDGAGLTATDSVEVVVTQNGALPPECSASAIPAAGDVPLVATYVGWSRSPDGHALSRRWEFDDRTETSPLVQRTYTTAGYHAGRWVVEDALGLACRDAAFVMAMEGGLPSVHVVTQPGPRLPASCGVPFTYGPHGRAVASGHGPIEWEGSEANPEGMAIDRATGEVRWLPMRTQAGTHVVSIRATNGASSDAQTFEVEVQCGAPLQLGVGCGCSSTGAVPLWLALLGLLAARRRSGRALTPSSARPESSCRGR